MNTKSEKYLKLWLRIASVALFMAINVLASDAYAQRKVTPVNTPQTATQPINELKGDTAYLNRIRRETMKKTQDEHGNIVYIDTVNGREWRDSTVLKIRIPMKYPLMHAVSVSVDLWNPVMRVFGQHYGLIDFAAQLSMHNRYKPTFETGLGMAHNKPADNNFTYKSPLSVYVRVGADYNFLYNSNPEYQYFIGLRYGCSKFSYSIEDININSTYWDEDARPSIPAQRPFVGWWEFAMGLKVQLWGPISAGWTFRYHNILHESKTPYGKPWYIPGYGTRGGAISGSLNITYTLELNKRTSKEVDIIVPGSVETMETLAGESINQ